MRVRWMAAVLALAAAGCTETAPLEPVNAQAQAMGTPVLHFSRGVPGGVMRITMPNGENLPGTFSISENGATLRSAGGPGNFSARARGPATTLTCHGDMVAGHGTAECQSQDGAIYQARL